MSAAKGGCRQRLSGPGGTTSTCPAKVRCLGPSPIAAKRFSTGSEPGSEKTGRSTENPEGARRRSSTSKAGPHRGVTVGARTRSTRRSLALGIVIVRLGAASSCGRPVGRLAVGVRPSCAGDDAGPYGKGEIDDRHEDGGREEGAVAHVVKALRRDREIGIHRGDDHERAKLLGEAMKARLLSAVELADQHSVQRDQQEAG